MTQVSEINWLDLLNPAVTLVAGLIALWVYQLNKKHQQQDAAILIVMDIRRAEQAQRSLMEKGSIDRTMKPFPTSANWLKGKHLFARTLVVDDLALIDRFFDGCEEIESARLSMVALFQATLLAKATASQEQLIELSKIADETERARQHDAVVAASKAAGYYFDADEPKERVAKVLLSMGRPSTSVGFSKLVQIAKIS